MLTSRILDEFCEGEFVDKGVNLRHYHSSIGQEALSVGGAIGLRKNDFMYYTHRGVGPLLAKGISLDAVMRDLFFKPGGTNRGTGSVMHSLAPEIGIPGRNGVFGDRFGRKYVIWFSILGAAPFALAMPYVNLTWTIVFTFLSGLIIASAFSSIVVYATDLMPDKVGLIAGIFFGLMFGLGGIGSAFFGWLADKTSVEFIFKVSAFLPLLGIIAGLLPDTQKRS